MLNKFKTQIQKDFGISQQPTTQSQSQQHQVSQPTEVVTFSLAKMGQFSHEELQQVIHRYDAQVKKLKQQIVERDTKISALEARVEQVVNEQQSVEEMLNLRSEEINGLKQHVQKFSVENASLTRLVQALEQSALETEEIEKENENLLQQLEELQSLNKELQNGDADLVYKNKYEGVILEHDKLKLESQQTRIALDRSNQQLSQVMLESEQLDLSLQQTEAQIAKKDRLIEQLKQRQIQLLDEKETTNETITKLTEQLKLTEQTKKQIGKSTDNVLTEHAERLRGKELVIQDLNLQLKSSNQKITSMQDKEAYYKRQIEQLQKNVYELQQDKQKSQTIFVTQQNQNQLLTHNTTQEDQNSDISQLMNCLKEIQGTGALPIQSSSQGESSVEPETLTTDPIVSEKSIKQEIQQLRAEYNELQSEYQKISDLYQQIQEQKQLQDQQLIQSEEQMAQKNQMIQELERRRKMGRDEVKQLLQKTPKVPAIIQQAGILQLRVLKKDLQQLYKDFLTTSDPNSLEKSINDMIFNVNDCISEVELTQSN